MMSEMSDGTVVFPGREPKCYRVGLLLLSFLCFIYIYIFYCREYGIFPVRGPNGYQIIFHRLRLYDASKYVFTDGVKCLAMCIDACLHVEGTVPGYVFLFDMKGVKLTHLTRLSLSALKKFFLYVQV